MVAWTANQISTLREMWALGIPGKKIGELLGKTRSATLGKARSIGLNRKNETDIEKPKPAKKVSAPKPPPPPKPPKPIIVAPPKMIQTEKTQLEVESQSEHWVPFMEQNGAHCKWIVTGHEELVTMVCGSPRVHDKPYCPRHCHLAYAPPQARRTPPRPSYRR